jgi:hypothetical protein
MLYRLDLGRRASVFNPDPKRTQRQQGKANRRPTMYSLARNGSPLSNGTIALPPIPQIISRLMGYGGSPFPLHVIVPFFAT